MKKLLAVGIAVLALSGCSKAVEPFRDAPLRGHDDGPARGINMPDGFSNVAAKCDGPNMVYVAFKGDANRAAISVVPNDPRCTK